MIKAQDKGKGTEKVKTKKDEGGKIQYMNPIQDPVKDALSVLQCFKVEKSSEIKSITNPVGLMSFSQEFESSNGCVYFKDLPELIDLWLPQQDAEKWKKIIEKKPWGRGIDGKRNGAFFCNPTGGKTCVTFEFERIRQGSQDPGDEDKNQMEIAYCIKKLNCTWEIASSFMIVTNTRSTFFREKSQDSLVTIPTPLTDAHFKLLQQAESYLLKPIQAENEGEEPYKKRKLT